MIVKKISSSKVLFTVSFCLFFVSILAVSCDNFLNGSDIKENLEKTIEYANASYAQIEISANSQEVAQMIPAIGYYNNHYKKSDSISLKFESKTGYKFVGWYAEPEGCVEFTNIETSENIHTATARIIDSSRPIKISPRCNTVPTVVSYSPSNPSNYYHKDSSITINFNKKMNAEDFNFNHIKISTGFVDLSEYFYEPENINDGKTVRIRVNRETFPLNDDSKMAITVALSGIREDSTEANGLVLEDFNFSYLIKNSVDDIPPSFVQNDFRIFKIVNGMEGELVAGSNNYSENHLKDTIRIKAKAYDKDGDGLKLEVTEELRKTAAGQILETETYFLNFDSVGDDVFELDKGCILKSQNDGLIKLTVTLSDLAENKCAEKYTYYFVRDTSVSSMIKVWNEPLEGNSVYLVDVIDSLKLIKFSLTRDYWTTENYENPSYSLYLGNKLDSLENVTNVVLNSNGSDSDIINGSFKLDSSYNINDEKDIYIKVLVNDSLGNANEKTFTIPGKVNVVGARYFGRNAFSLDSVKSKTADFEKHFYLSKNTSDASRINGEPLVYQSYNSGYLDSQIDFHFIGVMIVSYMDYADDEIYLYSSVSNAFSYDKNASYAPVYLSDSEIPKFTQDFVPAGNGQYKLTINYKTNPKPGCRNFVIVCDDWRLSSSNSPIDSFIANRLKDKTSYQDMYLDTEIYVQTGNWVYVVPGILDENNVPHIPNPVKENVLTLKSDYDNMAPNIYGNWQSIDDEKFYINYTDTAISGSKISTGFDENTYITYSVHPYFSGCENLSTEEIRNLDGKKTISINPIHDYVSASYNDGKYMSGFVKVDASDLEDGTYFIDAEISDKNGNRALTSTAPVWVFTNSKIAKPVLTGSKLTFVEGRCDNVQENIPDPDALPYAQDEEDRFYWQEPNSSKSSWYNIDAYVLKKGSNKWVKKEDTHSEKTMDAAEMAFTLDSTDLFVKTVLNIKDYYYEEEGLFSYRTVPQYIGNGIEVETKEISELSNEVYIAKSDQPYIAETFISKNNYGNNIDLWLLKAKSENLKYMKDMDFYSIDVSSIESGKYYCVIYHFADGSALISKVKNK